MKDSLIKKSKECGVVGAGGAGFPTHIKLKQKVEIVIMNCAECEPLSSTDTTIIQQEPQKLLEGLKKIIDTTGAKQGHVALKAKKIHQIQILKRLLPKFPNIRLYLLPDFYPVGEERILTYEITKRVVPPDGFPPQVGVLVQNAKTVLDLFLASKDIPVTDRILSIVGVVSKPAVVKVPLGTRIKDILTLITPPTSKDFVVIKGGVMSGEFIFDLDMAVVTKTTSLLVVIPKIHPLVQLLGQSRKRIFKKLSILCLKCRRCTDLCPRYQMGYDIQPHFAFSMSDLRFSDQIKKARLCSLCGICELFACPFGLSPKRVFQYYKEKEVGFGLGSEVVFPRFTFDISKVSQKRLIHHLRLWQYLEPIRVYREVLDVRRVRIPFLQHIGRRATPVVTKGRSVNKGDLIGEIPGDVLGARVHASIDGVVREVNEEYIVIER
jgi:Na+-translocating ferredoxin:NAD+ oxidoreductase RnfC subunit